MKIGTVKELLKANVECGGHRLEEEIDNAFGADLMSDVLAYAQGRTLILTGMVNTHVIRTAEMLDVPCILFVRGKKPTEEILKCASEHDMVILTTEKTLYTSCGILYNAGLPGCSRNDAI
jgi:predicted transcriptional regulator